MANQTFYTSPVSTDTLGSDKVSYLSWKSIVAGLVVAVFFHATLLALGMAIGGPALKSFNADNAGDFSIAGAVYIGVTALASIFIGSYIASRTTRTLNWKLGGMIGLTTTALFFVLALGQVQLGLSGAAKGLGSIVSAAGKGGADLLSVPAVQEVVEDATGGLNLKQPAPEVAKGLAARLLQGKTESAKNYLVANSNLTPQEADQKIATAQAEFNSAIVAAKDHISNFLTLTGLSAFLVMILGAALGFVAGTLGARANRVRPYYTYSRNSTATSTDQNYRVAV